jgi:prolyl oligopeptidase
MNLSSIDDPFFWLEDWNDPRVKEWTLSQDHRSRARLAVLRKSNDAEAVLRRLVYRPTQTAPVPKGKRLFFERKAETAEKAVIWVQERSAKERMLLDPTALSKDGSISIGGWSPSRDGRWLAYFEKQNNADDSTLRVLDVDSGAVSEIDSIPGLRYTQAEWHPDSSGFYYTWLPADGSLPLAERMARAEVRFHRLRRTPDDTSTDVTVRSAIGDPERWLGAGVTGDGQYLVLSISHGWSEEDVYLRRLDRDDGEWTPLAVGTKALYRVVSFGPHLFVATNRDAPNWRVFQVNPSKMDFSSWTEIVPESRDTVIQDIQMLGGKLVVEALHLASSRLLVYEPTGNLAGEISLPERGTLAALQGQIEDDTIYVQFSSFERPSVVLKGSVARRSLTPMAKEAPQEGLTKLKVEQVFVPSKDGTRVSAFLIHDGTWAPNHPLPTILYGYGGFNISLTPEFSPMIHAWVAHGGAYVMANLRGGGEYGEAWHQAGMRENKQNVFDDVLAVGEWLLDQGYVRPGGLGIRGGSNGGLLVGAAVTQRPDLFGAAVAAVPLFDMLRYPYAGAGKAWIPEYGDPEHPEAFEVLKAYSPYHRLREGQIYPPILVLSADSDDRVDPMHARKFVAKMQAVSEGDATVLLRIEKNAGHGGADLRKAYVEQAADEVVFFVRFLAERDSAD